MQELKNCPHCGGILDDTGRCIYCKSKVYDLTDVNLDMDRHNILVVRIKVHGKEMILNCYPANVSVEYMPHFDTYRDETGMLHDVVVSNNMKVHLDLVSI